MTTRIHETAEDQLIEIVGTIGEAGIAAFLVQALEVRWDAAMSEPEAEELRRIQALAEQVAGRIARLDARFAKRPVRTCVCGKPSLDREEGPDAVDDCEECVAAEIEAMETDRVEEDELEYARGVVALALEHAGRLALGHAVRCGDHDAKIRIGIAEDHGPARIAEVLAVGAK